MTAAGALAGLYLPQLRMDYAAIEARTRVAEDAGFHSVWFMDHLAPPAARGLDCLEAWTVATAVAMQAELVDYGFGDTTPKRRSSKLAETLEILELLWTGEPVDYAGDHWTLRQAVCCPRSYEPACG